MRSAVVLVNADGSGGADDVPPLRMLGARWLAVAAGLSAGEMRIVWFLGNVTNVMAAMQRSSAAVAVSRAGSRRAGW
jgi:hypothetical protein